MTDWTITVRELQLEQENNRLKKENEFLKAFVGYDRLSDLNFMVHNPPPMLDVPVAYSVTLPKKMFVRATFTDSFQWHIIGRTIEEPFYEFSYFTDAKILMKSSKLQILGMLHSELLQSLSREVSK